jgi:very-short-patch-repair endonuclease
MLPKDQFEFALKCRKGWPKFVREFQFDNSKPKPRRWMFDYCWPELKVAVEIEGGTFMKGGGRHSRGATMWKDADKYNAAAMQGWTVIRLTNHHLVKKRVHFVINQIICLLDMRGG